MLESSLQKKLHKYCAKNDIFRINIQKAQINGLPDNILILRDGTHIYLELKKEDGTGRVSPIQEFRIAELKGFKVNVFVCDSMKQIEEIINGTMCK